MKNFKKYVTKDFTPNAAAKKLSAENQEYVEAACEKHAMRADSRRKNIDVLSERSKDYFLQRYKTKIKIFIWRNFVNYYRVATSKWAGGDNFLELVYTDQPGATGAKKRVWSNNGKWGGNDGYFKINVSPDYNNDVVRPGLAWAGDMLTTHAKNIGADVWAATWLEQGVGFSLKVKTGYIMRFQGQFYHGKSIRSCQTMITKSIRAAEKTAKIEDLWAMNVDELIEKFGDLIVTKRDSAQAGNCPSGTESWINKNLPGRSEATVREILTVTPDNIRAVKAVKTAIAKHI